MDHTALPLLPEQRLAYGAAIVQSDAIFALEGMTPSAQDKAIDAAVLAGRVSPEQARQELCAHIVAHRTVRGFIESRSWA